MTQTAKDMPSLPNRLEAAERGTPALDAEIELLVPQWHGVVDIRLTKSGDGVIRTYRSTQGFTSHGTAAPARWSQVTDEAYRLVDQLYPDHVRSVLQSDGENWLFTLTVEGAGRYDVFVGHGATRALAICAAVFWAKEKGAWIRGA